MMHGHAGNHHAAHHQTAHNIHTAHHQAAHNIHPAHHQAAQNIHTAHHQAAGSIQAAHNIHAAHHQAAHHIHTAHHQAAHNIHAAHHQAAHNIHIAHHQAAHNIHPAHHQAAHNIHIAHHQAAHNIHAAHHLATHSIQTAHNIQAAHQIPHTNPDPFHGDQPQSDSIQRGTYQRPRDYGSIAFGTQQDEQRRSKFPGAMIVIGAFVLIVSAALIICGILELTGVIPGFNSDGTVIVGIALLGFGGVSAIAGLTCFIISCIAMRLRTDSGEQMAEETVWIPPEHLSTNAFFNQLSGDGESIQPYRNVVHGQPQSNVEYGQLQSNENYVELDQPPGDAQTNWHTQIDPLPVSEPPPCPGQASESSSTITARVEIGFVDPSVANP